MVKPVDLSRGKKIDFGVKKEEWNEYKLHDGTTLKIKLTLIDVIRMPDHNPLGEPIYHIMSQNLVKAVDVPKKLMKKPKPPTTPIA